jgi:hypothetical protein
MVIGHSRKKPMSGDASLRLKNGFAQDDDGLVVFLLRRTG